MMQVDDILEILSECESEMRARFGVGRLTLFGSIVRGEAGPDSDLDILECAGRIAGYPSGAGFESFSPDFMAQDAVLRNLEVIGEAVKRMPEEWRERAPAVPSPDIADPRDHLIH